jgi:hypothetical protein
MVLIRFVCHAKIGQSSEVVAGFKQSLAIIGSVFGQSVRGRVLTDLSGPFDTAVLEVEVESLAEWERLRVVIFSNPQVQEAEAAMPDLVVSGQTEFYTIEAT